VFVWSLLFHRLINAPGSPWPDNPVRKVNEGALAGPSPTSFLNVEPELGTSARGGLVATNAARIAPSWSRAERRAGIAGSGVHAPTARGQVVTWRSR
jgi:hypothetical protein